MNTETMQPSAKMDFSTDAVLEWWKKLQDNSKERAKLRRLHSPNDIMLHIEYHRLAKMIFGDSFYDDSHSSPKRGIQLARVVAVCAHIKSSEGMSSNISESDAKLGRLLAQSESGEPLISDTRFKRLLNIAEDDNPKIIQSFTRLVKHLKGYAPVKNVAELVYYWGDISKKKIAADYYFIVAKTKKDEE